MFQNPRLTQAVNDAKLIDFRRDQRTRRRGAGRPELTARLARALTPPHRRG